MKEKNSVGGIYDQITGAFQGAMNWASDEAKKISQGGMNGSLSKKMEKSFSGYKKSLEQKKNK